MIDTIKPYLNFTQLFVALSYGYFLVNCNSKNTLQRILFFILSLSFTVEVIVFLLLVFKNEQHILFVYSINALLHNSLWFFMLYKVLHKNYLLLVLRGYVVMGLLNLFFYEGLDHFNHFTFIAGALLYIAIFVHESFYLLQKERLSFFLSNGYLLLFSPIVFMLGYSILISFNSKALNTTIVFAGITLYDLIGYFINFIYYSLLALFCYREKKLRYV